MADLLPNNATVQEQALAAAIDASFAAVPVPIRTLWNPDTCPADTLAWFSWGFSVDEWNPDWADVTKRAVISAAYDVHVKKGTVGAMRAAVAAVSSNADIVEWFDNGAAAYTFEVNIDVTSTGIEDPGPLDELEAVALSAKNARSHLTAVNAVIVDSSPMYIGAAFIDQVVIESLPFPSVIESRL